MDRQKIYGMETNRHKEHQVWVMEGWHMKPCGMSWMNLAMNRHNWKLFGEAFNQQWSSYGTKQCENDVKNGNDDYDDDDDKRTEF